MKKVVMHLIKLQLNFSCFEIARGKNSDLNNSVP